MKFLEFLKNATDAGWETEREKVRLDFCSLELDDGVATPPGINDKNPTAK